MTINPYKLYQLGLRNPKTRWFVIIISTLYVLSPIDLIPEVLIPFIGLIDDGIILTILVSELVKLSRLSRKK